MAQRDDVDFNLPDDILAVISNDPYDQLDVARKITSTENASIVTRLESDSARQRQQIADRDRTIGELQEKVERLDRVAQEYSVKLKCSLEENVACFKIADRDRTIGELQEKVERLDRAAQEYSVKLKCSLEENAKLVQERDMLSVTTKKLATNLAKLETFEKQLMQTLSEDNLNQLSELADVENSDNFMAQIPSWQHKYQNLVARTHSLPDEISSSPTMLDGTSGSTTTWHSTQNGTEFAITQYPTPAAVPWSARRGNFSDKARVLKMVKGILNKLTPEKFDVLKGQLIKSGITTPDILMSVVTLIFEKAVLEPTFCQMYAQLCSDLSYMLPEFPDEEYGGMITFKRALLNSCQEVFEGSDNLRAEMRELTDPDQETDRHNKDRLLKLRKLGNIRLIGELFKQKMFTERIVHEIIKKLMGHDSKTCPAEENVEAICHFFNTIGKQLDGNPKSKKYSESYFNHLKDLTANPQLAPHIRFMVRDVLDLRSNNWVPRREEVDPLARLLVYLSS